MTSTFTNHEWFHHNETLSDEGSRRLHELLDQETELVALYEKLWEIQSILEDDEKRKYVRVITLINEVENDL